MICPDSPTLLIVSSAHDLKGWNLEDQGTRTYHQEDRGQVVEEQLVFESKIPSAN
jgi:hypothetical protein